MIVVASHETYVLLRGVWTADGENTRPTYLYTKHTQAHSNAYQKPTIMQKAKTKKTTKMTETKFRWE